MQNPDWQPGDIASLKKPHACGSTQWRIERVGMDMRLQCLGCGRNITLTRYEFSKRVRQKTAPADNA